MINFKNNQIKSYGDDQDQDLKLSILEDGKTLKLLGNGWRKIDLPYTITPNTVLSFQFQSTTPGEIHGIGFGVDNQINENRTFKLYGTQDWGIDSFDTYASSSRSWQTYSIPVGQFYTGDVSYLTFTNDHDIARPNAESLFRNISVQEVVNPPSTTQVSPPLNSLDSSLENIGETGHISGLTHQKQTITLKQQYKNPVVLVQSLSFNEGQPAAIRIDNIENNSFELFIQEPSNQDERHAGEDISYIVLEAGSWALEDGTKVEVGTLDSNQFVTSGFETVQFGQDFSNSPIVFSQVQTTNGLDFVRTRQQQTTTNSFQVGMEEEEQKQRSGHNSESIGWLAIEAGSGSWTGLSYQVGQTGDSITHEWEPINLSGFNSSPNFLASLASYDGSDSAGLRYRNLNTNSVDIKIEEDTSKDLETEHTDETVNFLAIEGDGLLKAHKTEKTTTNMGGPITTRDATKWPFASHSIWNTPIGSEAEYVDANIGWAKHATADVDHFYILDGNDPLQPLYNHGSWGPGRSTGTIYQNISLPLPDDFFVPDAKDNWTPNNSAAFLLPDGRTLVQASTLTRDRKGEAVYGSRLPYTANNAIYEDILGEGILGGHGGTGLSSIGGTIRKGELTGSDPIRHALKVNLWGAKYYSHSQGPGGGLGYRWPAKTADAAVSPTFYGGSTPELLNGSLLALPPAVTPESLGIETEAGRKLFYAFQNYGAYIADNTGWNAHAMAVERGVKQEFKKTYGYNFGERNTAFFNDYMQLFSNLHVVDNNHPNNIGGGGSPRAPLAPTLTTEGAGPVMSERENGIDLSGNHQPNRLEGKGGHDFLRGGGSHDFLLGSSGHDTLNGGDGNDHLIGDSGNDRLIGEQGNDYLDGGYGRDNLKGGEGDDHLSGWQGNDTLDGGAGYDVLVESGDRIVNRGNVDFILTNTGLQGSGTDVISNIEHVVLSSGNGNNVLDASAFTQGTVRLDGGSGHDTLLGGALNDTLVSSSGKDILTGGAGEDVFALNSRTRFLRSKRRNPHKSGDFALITDFEQSKDHIELEGTAEDYVLSSSPVAGISGTAIYLDINSDRMFDTEDKLIAVVQNMNNLNLTSSSFSYV